MLRLESKTNYDNIGYWKVKIRYLLLLYKIIENFSYGNHNL